MNSTVERATRTALGTAIIVGAVLTTTSVLAQQGGGMMGGGAYGGQQRQQMMQQYGGAPGQRAPVPQGGYGYAPGMGRGGYGYGPGMMGPGMMGPGYGYGPGPQAPGYGYGPGPQAPGYGGPGMGGAMGALNLSEQQQKQIGEIQQKTYQQMAGQQAQLAEAYRNMQQELSRPKPDQNAVSKAYDRMAQIQKQMLEERLRAHNQVQNLLTEEQRNQLRNMYGPGAGMMY